MIHSKEPPPEISIRELIETDRQQALELAGDFYKMVNQLPLDGLFEVKPRAATKILDIYFKLQDSQKVLLVGAFNQNRLVSMIWGRIEEKPYLREEKTFFIDLAVTKKQFRSKGMMQVLLQKVYEWCSLKELKSVELRAITANQLAVQFWEKEGFNPFYIRFRKRL